MELLITVVVLALLVAGIVRLLDPAPAGPRSSGIATRVGDRLPEFELAALDGPLRREAVAGTDFVLAFFTEGCGECTEAVTVFAECAAAVRGGGGVAVAVVIDGPGEKFVGLADHVVVDPPDGPAQCLFGVTGCPSFLRYNRYGTAIAAGTGVATLRRMATA